MALPNCIRQKRRCMSGVTAIVRTASRHGPLVAVADQCDQTATLSLLLSAWAMAYRCQKKVSTACLSVVFTCNTCWPNGSYYIYSSIVWK